MISIRCDPFGPPIIFKHHDFDDKLNDLTVDETLPFASYHAAGRTMDWLIPALYSVDPTRMRFGLSHPRRSVALYSSGVVRSIFAR